MEHGTGTHEVFNQTPPLTDYNLYGSDVALQEAVQREGGRKVGAGHGEHRE